MGATGIIEKGFPSGRELHDSVQARYGGMLKSEVIGFVASKCVMALGVDVALLNYSAILHRLQGVCNAARTARGLRNAAAKCSTWGSDGTSGLGSDDEQNGLCRLQLGGDGKYPNF